MEAQFEFDVAISYASEDEAVASALRRELEARGVETFFAPHRPSNRLGELMEGVFTEVFARKTRFAVIVVSDHYPRKHWTMLELATALQEERRRGETFIIPAILSEARIEGLPFTRFPLDLRRVGIREAAAQLTERVISHRGEIAPREEFERAFLEWKREGFLPGAEKGSFFLRHLSQLEIDVDRCEFLLNCPSGSEPRLRDVLGRIDATLLVAAGCAMSVRAGTKPSHRVKLEPHCPAEWPQREISRCSKSWRRQ